MRIYPLLLFIFIVSFNSAAPAMAGISDEWTWERVTSQEGDFSVEVPCPVTEATASVPAIAAAQHLKLDKDNYVVCVRNGLMMVAGVKSIDGAEELDLNMFDLVRQGLVNRAGEKSEVEIEEKLVDGRRVIVSTELNNDVMAQSILFELSAGSIVLLLGGGPQNDELTLSEVPGLLNKFSQSVEIAE